MIYASKTDVGLVRKLNEDSILAHEDLGIFGVADGMGGHNAGEIASSIALEVFIKTMEALVANSERPLEELIQEAFNAANQRVYRLAQEEDRLRGMGTTLTLGVIRDRSLHLAHVGDSRAYLYRKGHLETLSEDHSLVYELYKKGGITETEAFNHPQKNVLTRALGTEEIVEGDFAEWNLELGDIILFCTDGLCGVVPPNDLSNYLGRTEDLESICNLLVQEAINQGGPDNISVVLVKIDK